MKFSYSLIKKLLSEAPPKAKLADGLNSYSLETENLDGDLFDISLPSNRYSDAASHLGIAREVSVIFGSNPHTKFGVGVKLKNPIKTIVNLPTDRGFLEVKVENRNFCPRYAARYFENVKIGDSPAWMKEILRTCGLKPINNVVDLMNFVMFEVGQPLHAFDFDKIADSRGLHADQRGKSQRKSASSQRMSALIVVRKAKNGEKIETLDGQHFVLNSDDLVIANGNSQRESASSQRDSAILAIAGIKGGANSGVDGATRRIIVEAANFAPVDIFKTSRRLKLHTDASTRFSHGISPALVDWGMDRATQLLVGMGAKLIDSVDAYPRPAGDELISFSIDAYRRLIGAPVSLAEAKKYFIALGFGIEQKNPSELAVRVPAWRTDIERAEDLIEEIGRLKGYNNLKPEPPAVSIRSAEEEDVITLKDRVRQFMTHANVSEAYNYSFGPQGGGDAVQIANPLNEESKYLRKALEPGLMRNITANARFFDEVRIFEIGKTFSLTRANEGVKEELRLGAALGAKKKPTVLELKGLFDGLLKSLGLADFSFVPRGASIRIESDHHVLGELKTVHLEKAWTAAVGEINLDALLPLLEEEREFKPLPKYPAVIRDISLFVPGGARIGDILEAIQETGGALVEDVDLVDEFHDEKFGGRQSFTFRIVFQAEDRTLTDQEVNREMEKISTKLKKDFRAEIR